MKTKIFSIPVLLIVSVSAPGAQADRNFDGVWVGTETTGPRSAIATTTKGAGSGTSNMLQSMSETHRAKIIIAEGGKLLAIAEGNCPGRYTDVHRSGNVLSFQAGDCKLEVSLSADGKTLTEKGNGTKSLATGTGMARYTKQVAVQITGSFSKQK